MTKTILGGLDLKKVGARLRKTDRFLLDIFKVRLAQGGLSDYVAENKRAQSPDGVFPTLRLDVEAERIQLMRRWAEENGINPDFAHSIMYQVISESCRRQNEVMIARRSDPDAKLDEGDPDAVYAAQKENLLLLTAAVAPGYDQGYGKGCLGSKLYFSFEKQLLMSMIGTDEGDNALAIDLGCSTGIMAFKIAPNFQRVIGYDISPDMIAVANGKKTPQTAHVEFVNADIEAGLDLPDNSVSLAVMNMGTASDIRNLKGVLETLQRVLKPGGRFFLSFYNTEGLFYKISFLPWPMPIAAHIDLDKRCLEVHSDGKVYLLYARPRSLDEVRSLLSCFEIENTYTFPTLASIIPNVITEDTDDKGNRTPNEAAQKLVKQIDMELAGSALNCGTYIIVTGHKR